MTKKKATKTIKTAKPRPNAIEKEYLTIREELRKLASRTGFLVRRSEFLYQQAMMWHLHADELLRDRNDIKQIAESLEARIDAISERAVNAATHRGRNRVRPR